VLDRVGIGCIVFSPLAQGMLTDKYLDGIPEESRAARGGSLTADMITEQSLTHIRALNEIAEQRGQSLAQMALAWTLHDPRITSTLIGASSVAQLDENLGALGNLDFSAQELRTIDDHAVEAGINIWSKSSEG
jgi:L-glyceraldehyde 3-phosphate reductase